MKNFKKIILGGLSLFIIIGLFIVVSQLKTNRALAAVPPLQTSGTASLQTYLDSCVERIYVSNGGGNWCQWFNDSVPDTSMLYGQNSAYSVDTIVNSSNYQVGNGNSSVGGTSVPGNITIINGQNQGIGSLGDSVLSPTGLFTNLSYSGLKITYFPYNPGPGGDSRYVMLIALHTDGTPPQILALVNKTIFQAPSSHPNGNGVVYAYKINKLAVTSTPTGAPVTTGEVQKGEACAGGTDCLQGVCTKTGGDCTSTSATSCDGSSGSPLAWLACPVFEAISAVVQNTENLFEKLLSFTVSQDLGTASCAPSDASCQSGVKVAWSIIKNIASIVLVLVMLIMVFSQAISIGPFDAYTIRKILPKLVAAVILMQLSWPLVAWIIDMFNDLGKGLEALLFAPFQGGSTLNDLGKLINHAGIGATQSEAFNWVSLLAVGTATLAALPTALFLAFASMVGLLVAVITLIFRRIIIVVLLIFAPLALIAWILPGTQRYWKLWSDNFIKILAMYPLAVAIIAVGRIFAFVATPHTSASDDFGGKFLALLFVLVGFIGPLFILPKTFKWGGGIMSAAGGAIMNAGNRINKGAEQPLKGIAQRQQGKWAKQYNPQAGLGSRMLRRVQSGHMLPLERSRRLTIAAGDKWAGERNDEAQALVQRTYEKAFSGGYTDGNGKVWKPGVGAAKQALVDLSGRQGSDADSRAAQAANKQLLDTSSWIELQHSRITTGPNKGKRVSETGMFRNTLANSPQHYSATIRSRPDMAPDVIESAESAVSKQLGRVVSYDTAYAEKDEATRQSIIAQLDKARLMEALTRLSPDAVPSMHQGLLEDIADYGHRTGDRGVANTLQERLTAFATSGSPAGANAIASLQGAEVSKKVDAALGHGYDEIDEATGQARPDKHVDAFAPENLTLSDIAEAAKRGRAPGAPAQPATTVRRTVTITPETVQQMGGDAVQRWVEAPIEQGGAGGWSNLSNEAVSHIQQNATGAASGRASQESQSRAQEGPQQPPQEPSS